MASPLTSKQYLFQLNLIYGAQAFVILMFGAVVFIINQSAEPSEGPYANLMIYILAAVVVTSLSAAHFIFGVMLRRIDREVVLKGKLQKYLTAVLVRSAVLEFPGLFASVVGLLSGSQIPLMAVLFILVVFILLRPTTGRIIQDLNLSLQEKGMLEDPGSTLGE
jgi:hypothetical protein